MGNQDCFILTVFGLWMTSRAIMAACYHEWLYELPTGWSNIGTLGIPAPWGIAAGGTALLLGLKILNLPW